MGLLSGPARELRFLRYMAGTLKHRKPNLVGDGFDPERVPAPPYLLDPGEGRYIPLDRALHQRLLAGGIRL